MYSTSYSCQIVMNLSFLDTFLKNTWISHFIEVKWEPSSFTQTDRHDLAKSCFCKLQMHLKICCITYFHIEQHQWYRHWYSAVLNELVLFLEWYIFAEYTLLPDMPFSVFNVILKWFSVELCPSDCDQRFCKVIFSECVWTLWPDMPVIQEHTWFLPKAVSFMDMPWNVWWFKKPFLPVCREPHEKLSGITV